MLSYLKREQYGSWPLLHGPYYMAKPVGANDGSPIYVRDEVKDKDRRTFLYTYEDGKKVKELIYNYSDTLIAAKYFVYDEKGRLIEEEDEDLDSYQKMVYQYEENHLASVTRYNKEEKEVARTEFFVDEQGRDSKMMNYALDEVDPENLRLISEISYERE